MISSLAQILPWSIRQRLRLYYSRYSFKQAFRALRAQYSLRVNAYLNTTKDPILFAGYIKSGNTWLRFLIYHYFNILEGKQETLTYNALNKLQANSWEGDRTMQSTSREIPNMLRTHVPYNNLLSVFSKGIYIYRNPLDTLVSAYHFNKQQAQSDAHHLDDIDAYVLYYLPLWEMHIAGYLKQKRFLALRYEDLIQHPEKELNKLISYLGYTYQVEAGQKSIALSSFDNIKAMGHSTGQQYGNGGKSFGGEFARKGKVGSFQEELKMETIERARPWMNKYGFELMLT